MSEVRAITVPRSARYHLLGGAGAECREAWFVLHGYGQLAGAFLEPFRALASPQRALVAPEALSRFYLRRGTGEVGASWMTKEARAEEIADTVRYLDLLAEDVLGSRMGDVAVHALGFSQGAAAAARWAALGRARIRRLTLWGGALPPDLDLESYGERLRGARWTFVLGDRDQTVGRAAFETGLERLRAAGIEPEVLPFAGGHELDGPTLALLARQAS